MIMSRTIICRTWNWCGSAHDHLGLFNEAVDGVNTVETEIADNDYAVGCWWKKLRTANTPKTR